MNDFSKVQLVNCTPHQIVFVLPYSDSTSEPVVIQPSGNIARATRTAIVEELISIDGGLLLPINKCSFGSLEGLPEPKQGVLYIVSAIAAQAALEAGRTDCVIVDETVRNEAGQIIGCKALARV